MDLAYKSFDSLIKLLDDLVKLDAQVEGCLRRVEKQMFEFSSSPDFSVWNVTNKTKCGWKDYVNAFKWNDSKYPRSAAIMDTSALIQSTVQKLDMSIRNNMSAYTELKTQYAAVAHSKKDATLVSR